MVRPCESCKSCKAMPPRITSGPWKGQHHLHDYCRFCSKDLCESCLKNGKCRESKTGKHEVESEDAE